MIFSATPDLSGPQLQQAREPQPERQKPIHGLRFYTLRTIRITKQNKTKKNHKRFLIPNFFYYVHIVVQTRPFWLRVGSFMDIKTLPTTEPMYGTQTHRLSELRNPTRRQAKMTTTIIVRCEIQK